MVPMDIHVTTARKHVSHIFNLVRRPPPAAAVDSCDGEDLAAVRAPAGVASPPRIFKNDEDDGGRRCSGKDNTDGTGEDRTNAQRGVQHVPKSATKE